MEVNPNDVLDVTRQQLSQAQQSSAMNAALALAYQRRVDELETLLREMKANALTPAKNIHQRVGLRAMDSASPSATAEHLQRPSSEMGAS